MGVFVAKYNMKTYNSDKADDKINEMVLMSDISKEKFFEWMNSEGYTLDKIRALLESNINSIEQYNFNQTLLSAKIECKIDLSDMIIYLEEYFDGFDKLLLLFSDDVKYELKKELSKEYHIKLDETILTQILD